MNVELIVVFLMINRTMKGKWFIEGSKCVAWVRFSAVKQHVCGGLVVLIAAWCFTCVCLEAQVPGGSEVSVDELAEIIGIIQEDSRIVDLFQQDTTSGIDTLVIQLDSGVDVLIPISLKIKHLWKDRSLRIYGDDDRVLISQIEENVSSGVHLSHLEQEVLLQARGVAAIVDKSRFVKIERGKFGFESMSTGLPCSGERFYGEPELASGTGFLINDSTVLTAAHCIKNLRLENIRLVFGWTNRRDLGDLGPTVEEIDVYSVKSIVVGRQPSIAPGHGDCGGECSDWALLTLQRRAPAQSVLSVDTVIGRFAGDSVYVVGHGMGKPLTFSPNGVAVSYGDFCCHKINCDVYQGNSGSPVFSAGSGEVVGMVIYGGQDYFFNKSLNCSQSVRIIDPTTPGEEIIPISHIIRTSRIPAED